MGKLPSIRPCRRQHRISNLSTMVSPTIVTRRAPRLLQRKEVLGVLSGFRISSNIRD
ncbi:hypothetical protein TIFTF001_017679 [Ficus carica]|uniref:Uncharacterized protein n=1 Tax=Ficus carica TaxID=3494 RepID=A0AA88A9Y3_FICCA|nr:hypothetical protein TIFTF001_017679 [Ficus carica]